MMTGNAYGMHLRAASIASLVFAWWAAATLAATQTLPTPMQVLSFVIDETASGELAYHFAMTLSRVAAAFVLAMLFGVALGLVMGRNRAVNALCEPWLITLLNVPALIVIVLCYIWIGLGETAAILAVAVNKIPNVAVTVREGARALNEDLLEMARVYRFSRAATLRDVILPQLQPYIVGAGRSGLALIWKIVLVVELLGRPNGVGFQIHLHFQTFDVSALMGYALTFVALMIVLETMVRPIERRADRWRLRRA